MKCKISVFILAFATTLSILTSTNVKHTNALTNLDSNNISTYHRLDNINTTGWVKSGNKWYYFNSNGVIQTGWSYINNTWYYFYDNGEMATGWINYLNGWYYLNESGSMVNGWLQYNNDWYYLNEGGAMVKGWLYNNGSWYYMNNSGAMVLDTVISTEYRILSDGRWDGQKIKQLSYNEAYKLYCRALEKINNETPGYSAHLVSYFEWIFPYSLASESWFNMKNKWEVVDTKLWSFCLNYEDGVEFYLYVDYKGRVYSAGDGFGANLIDLN